MKDEIKEILDDIKDILSNKEVYDVEIDKEVLSLLLDYITNLQKTNKNHSKKLIELGDKITNLQQENKGLEAENETLRSDFKNQVEYTNEIAKENEKLNNLFEYNMQTLVNTDKLYEDYKSRCEKANNQLKIIMQIIKEQPTRNIEDDEWLENRLIGIVNILQNGSEENE